MHYTKKALVIVVLLTLSSCNLFKENGIEFTIENQSNIPVKQITFTTSERLTEIKLDTLMPGEYVTKFLSMENNKVDGAYVLEVTRANRKRETYSCGYYSNGKALDRWIVLKIQNDTIQHYTSGSGI
ncbi:MAG: hypothetical protein NXH90_13615 [Flavobacteriaceae bacterium]|nr:hypothetical protein [Flavobacteriaceae bacterium]